VSVADEDEIPSHEKVVERHFYLSMLRAQYNKQLREDTIPQYSQGAIDLPGSVDKSLDHAARALTDWYELQRLMLVETDSTGRRVWELVGSSSPYSMYQPLRTANGIHMFDLFSVVVFLDAHHITCSTLSRDVCLGGGGAAGKAIIAEAARQVENAHEFLTENKVGADAISSVRTKQLLAVLFARYRKQVHKWMDRGVINNGDAEELIAPVHHAIKQVRVMRSVGVGKHRLETRASSRDPDSGHSVPQKDGSDDEVVIGATASANNLLETE